MAEYYLGKMPEIERKVLFMNLPDIEEYSVESISRDTLKGLKIAEVEFQSEQVSDAFPQPDWFGEGITCKIEYMSQSLAIIGLKFF